MTVHFAPQAEADFAAIVEYLAERNPAAAVTLGRPSAVFLQQVVDRAF